MEALSSSLWAKREDFGENDGRGVLLRRRGKEGRRTIRFYRGHHGRKRTHHELKPSHLGRGLPLASKLSKRLQVVQNVNGGRDAREILLDWRMLGIAEWMASRAEALGFRFPTGIQRKATGGDVRDGDRLIVISAQTGTGRRWRI